MAPRRSNLSRQLAGPVFIVLALFSAFLQPCVASNKARALLAKPDDIVPNVGLPDSAISERKAVFDVTTTDGTHHDLAVFVYEMNALADISNGPHVSEECKKNQDVAVVLLHGATYNHKYWDTPANVDNVEHSLARYLAKQCYYVMAPDMIGTGESDKPDGFTTTLADQTRATADFIRSIKENHNAARDHKAKKVIVVGHSFGSMLGQLLLGTNPGIADAFVATGWTNGFQPNAPDFTPLFSILDGAYITLPSDASGPFGNLRTAFYNLADTTTWTPAMLAYDVSNLADFISRPDGTDAIVPLLDNRRSNSGNDPTLVFQNYHTDQISVPIFILCGDQDIFADAAGCATGGIYYPNAASVTTYVQQRIGHVYNLHLTNRPGWEKIAQFIKSVA